jgi:hypothetical protein
MGFASQTLPVRSEVRTLLSSIGWRTSALARKGADFVLCSTLRSIHMVTTLHKFPGFALATLASAFCWSSPAAAAAFSFSTGAPDGLVATASRPSTAGKIEIESADDFILTSNTSLTSASFTGLLTGGASASNIGSVVVEIYRVFPFDSTDPPSGKVPTRVNSPSDVAFQVRTSGSELSFTTASLNASFTASNSVLNGINPIPNQATGGEGAVSGEELQFNVSLTSPLVLPAGHYFFIPQVAVTGGEFFWLSAPKPITGGTGPFVPDLQSWIRNENLAPDWLRVGTDITGQGPFNASFSVDGVTVDAVPEPQTYALMLLGMGVVGFAARRKSTRS